MSSTLEKFDWENNGDNSISEIDFFKDTSTEESKENETPEEEEKKEEPENKEEGSKEEEEIAFFGENETEDSEDSSENKSENVENSSLNNIGVFNFLKEKGFLSLEDKKEDEELDEDLAEAYIEEGIDNMLEEKLDSLVAELPESVKNLVKYASKGGDVEEYLQQAFAHTASGVSINMNMSDESNQEKFMRFKLAEEGHDEEYIDAQIEFLKDTDKLEKIATKGFDKWKDEQEENNKSIVQQQNEKLKKIKESQIQYRREIKDFAESVKSVKNVKFSRKDAKELPSYITEATEQLEDGRYVTPFYKDLSLAMKDKEKTFLLAKILKGNFDFSDIEKSAVTKTTKEIKNNIQRQKDTNSIKGGGSSRKPKTLSEYFN